MRKVRIVSNIIIFSMLAVLCGLALPIRTAVTSANAGDVHYRGNEDSAKVSLMINVYWGQEYLDDILKVLEDCDVKVTFFVGGMWVEKNQAMLKKMVEAGHEVGNHGYLHKDHDKLSIERQTAEIRNTHNLVRSVVGLDMTLFAPPSGAYNGDTVKVAKELGYETIMWTLDTIDWRDKDESLVFKRATKKLLNGALILMHPTAHTLAALPKIINHYKNNQFTIATVSDNIATSNSQNA